MSDFLLGNSMNPDDLAAYGRALYGGRWQTPLAEELAISDRTMRRWLAGDSPIPAGIEITVAALLTKRQRLIAELLKERQSDPQTAGAGRDIEAISKQLHKLHAQRVSTLVDGKGPVTVMGDGTLIFHLLPFSAVDERSMPAFSELCENPERFKPFKAADASIQRISPDGLLIGSNRAGLSKPQRAYVHVFRSGVVEAVVARLGRGKDDEFIQLPELEAIIIKHVVMYAQSLSRFGIRPPLLVSVTLADAKGRRMLQDFIGGIPEDVPYGPLDRAIITFDYATLETVPQNYNDGAKMLRGLLDHVASTAGLTAAPYFDEHGNYELASKL